MIKYMLKMTFFFALLHHILFAHACVTEKSPVTLAVVGWLS